MNTLPHNTANALKKVNDLVVNSNNVPVWLTRFVNTYQSLSTDNLEILSALYHKNVKFEDPLHQIFGYDALSEYFAAMYQNVSHCKFTIENVFFQDNQAAVYWQMTYRHRQLNKGKKIVVEGHSLIKGDDNQITYHRDYLDVGQMLYEQLPIFGWFIRRFKQRVTR